MSDLVTILSDALGSGNVRTEGHGIRIQGQNPLAVLTPDDAEQLGRAVALASAHGAAVVPYGGGSHQSIGRNLTLGGRPFVVLMTRKLDAVRDYTPDDMTISVGAGMTFGELRSKLAEHGQMLPMDVPLPNSCTIGGAIAVNADGPRRWQYGTLRDVLLGISVVEAGGAHSKAGGMTVKNVSGYDMMKLHTGALGTLGVITHANFKLYPRPRAAGSTVSRFASLSTAFALIDSLAASQLTPSAVELAGDLAGKLSVSVRAEGLPEAVARHLKDVPVMASAAGASETELLKDDAHLSHWAALHDAAQASELPDQMLLKITALPGELGHVLGQVATLALAQQLAVACTARALNGVAYVRLHGAAQGQINLHRALIATHPRVVLQSAPRDVRMQVPIWGNALNGLDLMQRIKKEFDPQNVLNPGRFVV